MSKTKLGFSTGKGFLTKVDNASRADSSMNSDAVNNVPLKYLGSSDVIGTDVNDIEYAVSKRKNVFNGWNNPLTCETTLSTVGGKVNFEYPNGAGKILEIACGIKTFQNGEISDWVGVQYFKVRIPNENPQAQDGVNLTETQSTMYVTDAKSAVGFARTLWTAYINYNYNAQSGYNNPTLTFGIVNFESLSSIEHTLKFEIYSIDEIVEIK